MRLATIVCLLLVGAVANPVPMPDADAAPEADAEHHPALASRGYTLQGSGYAPKVCPGTQIDSGYAFGNAARWRMYYSSANGGTNCLVVDNLSGSKRVVKAGIRMGSNQAIDSGQYSSYAGPVAIKGTNRKCVTISVWIWPPGSTVPPPNYELTKWCS